MSAEIQTLHIPFRQWLDGEGVAYTYHRPDQATGATLGDADFILYAKGRCLHIEFKDKETRISAVQLKRHAALAVTGTTVHVLRSLPAAIELTQAWRSTLAEILISASPTKATANLVRFGAGIFTRIDGRLQRIRAATPADSSIPVLAA